MVVVFLGASGPLGLWGLGERYRYRYRCRIRLHDHDHGHMPVCIIVRFLDPNIILECYRYLANASTYQHSTYVRIRSIKKVTIKLDASTRVQLQHTKLA